MFPKFHAFRVTGDIDQVTVGEDKDSAGKDLRPIKTNGKNGVCYKVYEEEDGGLVNKVTHSTDFKEARQITLGPDQEGKR